MTLTALPPTTSADDLPGHAVTGIELHRHLGLLRRHATTVTVVTAPGQAGGPPVGFTATSFTSVSLRPQLVSFCLDRDSTSWPTVARARHVAIHLLAEGQQEVARIFATRGVDRFADTSLWRQGPYGLPLLHGALAVLTCEVVQRIPAGDHAIVLGRPVSAEHRDGEPLLYHMGGYASLAR
ncbi:flavin reductase family protein [Catellatospora citrea]|uniref:Flavin-dependent reductase n=1 Tax=Catellatospora citrea TaxID=53366 RepID=A0A8J3NX16_9ACTN|nr:flavin reductase family protein [Catellatospora citrea]RKE12809.1 flavin reductase (DIM6/NTAB) family NADH-FMN oxidoreductase RutF [Catellatospora citrea]GIF95950.1 flavin-dependent reductase [Catellatospora citrea]